MIQDFLRFRQRRTPSATFRWADDSRNWVTDTLSREIDGTDNGKAGSDYVATINETRVTTGGPPLVQAQRRPAAVADAIDHLLARGELNGLRDARHAGSEERASNVGK